MPTATAIVVKYAADRPSLILEHLAASEASQCPALNVIDFVECIVQLFGHLDLRELSIAAKFYDIGKAVGKGRASPGAVRRACAVPRES